MNLAVDPILIPFDFGSKHVVLKDKNIMVDDLGILSDGSERSKVILCSTCHYRLTVDKKIPIDSLANYCWIGNVPEELGDLTWIKKSLISLNCNFFFLFFI